MASRRCPGLVLVGLATSTVMRGAAEPIRLAVTAFLTTLVG
jgi:hypothetical protein